MDSTKYGSWGVADGNRFLLVRAGSLHRLIRGDGVPAKLK